MKRRFAAPCIFLSALIAVFVFSSVSFAAHPLITDDTGTQGKGKMQIEINGETGYDKEKEDGVTVKARECEIAAAFAYGVRDDIDIVLGVPYVWSKEEEDDEVTADEDGVSDMSIELKWRVHEEEGLGLALKAGISLPTGDEEKGLGNGRVSYGLTFIATKEAGPAAVHLNLAYARNDFELEEDREASRRDIWHASLAAETEVAEGLKAVANIGVETNPAKGGTVDPGFILAGLIYAINENIDIDFGVKGGLNKPETDYTFLAGMAVRF